MSTNLVAASDSTQLLVTPRARPLVYSRYARAFFESLVIALVICWSPINALGYLAPAIALAWYVFRSRSQKALIGGVVWLVGWMIVIGIYALFNREFVFTGAIIAIVTYSAFATLLIIPARAIATPKVWASTLPLLRRIIYLEATLGIIQAVYGFTQTGSFFGTNGDYVEGTIHPALAAELSFSNPMFTVNMVMMLLVVAPTAVTRGKGWLAVILGSLALIIASVLHVLYFSGIALILSVLLIYPALFLKKLGIRLLILGVLFSVVAAQIVGIRPDFALTLVKGNLAGETPRGIILESTFNRMPSEYTFMPLFGIGPGQFSSRAGLIASGRYFGKPENPRGVLFLQPAMSPAFKRYVIYPWIDFKSRVGWEGSSTVPYFSWLSVYVEFGAIVFGIIVILVLYLILRLRRYARIPVLRLQTIALGTGIIFLFLLGIQENYWEVPQAIFVGILLLKLQYGNLLVQYDQLRKVSGMPTSTTVESTISESTISENTASVTTALRNDIQPATVISVD